MAATHAVYRDLMDATAVDLCMEASFTSPGALNLIVGRRGMLEVYELSNAPRSAGRGSNGRTAGASLTLRGSFKLHGRLAGIGRTRFEGNARDSLVLSFGDAKLSVVDFHMGRNDLKTTSMHYFEDKKDEWSVRPTHMYRPKLCTDPRSRCAAMVVYDRRLAVFPFGRKRKARVFSGAERDADDAPPAPAAAAAAAAAATASASGGAASAAAAKDAHTASSGVMDPYVVDLREMGVNHVTDLAFLHGFHDPTLLVLHQSRLTCPGRLAVAHDTHVLTTVSFTLSAGGDGVAHRHAVLGSFPDMPSDCSALVPLPEPLSGALVVSTNALYHFKDQAVAFALGLNEIGDHALRGGSSHFRRSSAAVTMDAARLAVLGPERVAASLLDGSMWLLSLRRRRALLVGIDMERIESPGYVLSCMCALGDRHMFLGSNMADSLLVQYCDARQRVAGERSGSLLPLSGVAAALAGRVVDIKTEGVLDDDDDDDDDDAEDDNDGDKKNEDKAGEEATETTDKDGEEPTAKRQRTETGTAVGATAKREANGDDGGDGDQRLTYKYFVRDVLPCMAPAAQMSHSFRPVVGGAEEEDEDQEGDGGARRRRRGARGRARARGGGKYAEFVACTGAHGSGGLSLFGPGVAPAVRFTQPLERAVFGCWTLRCPAGAPLREADGFDGDESLPQPVAGGSGHDNFILLSTRRRTEVMRAGEAIDRERRTQFFTDGPTFGAAEVLGGRLAVQVHARGVRLMDGARMVQELPTQGAVKACSIRDPYVLLLMADGKTQLVTCVEGGGGAEDENAPGSLVPADAPLDYTRGQGVATAAALFHDPGVHGLFALRKASDPAGGASTGAGADAGHGAAGAGDGGAGDELDEILAADDDDLDAAMGGGDAQPEAAAAAATAGKAEDPDELDLDDDLDAALEAAEADDAGGDGSGGAGEDGVGDAGDGADEDDDDDDLDDLDGVGGGAGRKRGRDGEEVGASASPVHVCAVARQGGQIEVYSVPDFRLLFVGDDFCDGPALLPNALADTGVAAQRREADPARAVVELCLELVGGTDSRPYLLAFLNNGDLLAYQAFAFTDAGLARLEESVPVRFARAQTGVITRPYGASTVSRPAGAGARDGEEEGGARAWRRRVKEARVWRGGQRLVPFANIGDRSGVIVGGLRPLVALGDRNSLVMHDLVLPDTVTHTDRGGETRRRDSRRIVDERDRAEARYRAMERDRYERDRGYRGGGGGGGGDRRARDDRPRDDRPRGDRPRDDRPRDDRPRDDAPPPSRRGSGPPPRDDVLFKSGVACAAAFHHANCERGFVYLNARGDLSICGLPPPSELNCGGRLPFRRAAHLGCTPHFLVKHERANAFAVVVSRPSKEPVFADLDMDEDEDEGEEAALARKGFPQQSRRVYVPRDEYEVLLFDPRTWEVCGRFSALEECETIISARYVVLEGNRAFLAIGTCNQEGEEKICRGRVILIELWWSQVVGAEGGARRAIRVKTYENLQRGPVTAVGDLDGFLVCTSGQRVLLYRYDHDAGTFTGRAFVDTDFYVTSLVTFRRMILAADAFHSCKLLLWEPVTQQIEMVGSHPDRVSSHAVDILVDGRSLNFAVTDGNGNVQLLQFAPHLKPGHRLSARADMHMGARTTAMVPLRVTSAAVQGANWAPDADPIIDPTADATLRTMLVGATLDGGVFTLSPVSEVVFRRLYSLHAQMTYGLPHHAGLNPRGYRLMRAEDPMRLSQHKGIVDDLLWRYVDLDRPTQVALASKIGTTPEKVVDNLLEVELKTRLQ